MEKSGFCHLRPPDVTSVQSLQARRVGRRTAPRGQLLDFVENIISFINKHVVLYFKLGTPRRRVYFII